MKWAVYFVRIYTLFSVGLSMADRGFPCRKFERRQRVVHLCDHFLQFKRERKKSN
jgi:hypothetical protein